MTFAAWRAVREIDVAAILCVSGTGFTVRQMARFRPECPIIGASTDPATVQQLTLSWGTIPVTLTNGGSAEAMVNEALEVAKADGLLRSGDRVAILSGDGIGAKVTNNLQIVSVP